MKKTISLYISFILLFILPVHVFATEKEDTYYIIMYTKTSYKNTPYEELFEDPREFLNPDIYGIDEIKSISVIAAYRDDNPHIRPPYYVLSIEINAENLGEASLKALTIFIRGLSAKSMAVDAEGYAEFLKNYIPEVTLSECHYALYTPGDIMCQNNVTATSARTVLRISVGLEDKEDFPWLIGDMNRDGKLTASDARTILRISVGLE